MSKQNKFRHTGHYVCECGKEFTDSQAFNGHKGRCKIHYISTGRLDDYEDISRRQTKTRSENRKKQGEVNKKEKEALNNKLLEFWLSERHKCERCGKVMTEYFGTGRFCSRFCANSHTLTTKEDGHKYVSKHRFTDEDGKGGGLNFYAHPIALSTEKCLFDYYTNPRYCKICGILLSYDKRNKNTCSEACSKKQHSINMSNFIQQNGPKNGDSHYKYGVYKGINCDSSWELAFVIYCLDHDINLKRCNKYFKYINENGKEKMYFPDFMIDGEYYEIKGRITEEFILKKEQFPKDKILNVIGNKEIQKYLKYARSEYGENFTEMYDKDSPSWMTASSK